MTCPQSTGSAISIVPQGTAELQRQISSPREKDSHPSLHSFNFLCLHRGAYEGMHSLFPPIYPSRTNKKQPFLNPTVTPSHTFPSQSTLNKIRPEKTAPHGRIPVQLQTSLPNCKGKLSQDSPICSHVRKFKVSSKPRVTLTIWLSECLWLLGELVWQLFLGQLLKKLKKLIVSRLVDYSYRKEDETSSLTRFWWPPLPSYSESNFSCHTVRLLENYDFKHSPNVSHMPTAYHHIACMCVNPVEILNKNYQ